MPVAAHTDWPITEHHSTTRPTIFACYLRHHHVHFHFHLLFTDPAFHVPHRVCSRKHSTEVAGPLLFPFFLLSETPDLRGIVPCLIPLVPLGFGSASSAFPAFQPLHNPQMYCNDMSSCLHQRTANIRSLFYQTVKYGPENVKTRKSEELLSPVVPSPDLTFT